MATVVYKGDRDFPDQDGHDDFTVNGVYDCIYPADYDKCGEIYVLNDKGQLVRQPGIDFDLDVA